jgi:glycerol uptake facilitator-like aquaporin
MVAGVSRTYPQPPATVSLALTRLGLALKVIRKGAFIGLFLAGAIGANWTDECWHFARCHSQRLKVLSCYSTTYSHTRFRFLLVQFFSALLSHIVLLVKKLKLRAQSRDSGYGARRKFM